MVSLVFESSCEKTATELEATGVGAGPSIRGGDIGGVLDGRNGEAAAVAGGPCSEDKGCCAWTCYRKVEKVSLRMGPGEQQKKHEQTSRSAESSLNPCAHCVQEG